MKTQVQRSTMTSLLVIMALGIGSGIGCAKGNSASSAGTEAPAPTPTATPESRTAAPSMNYQAGGTADFVPVDLATMNTYAALHPLNSPTSFKVNVNISDDGSGRYAGTVQISYYDNSQFYNGVFNSGAGTNEQSGNRYYGFPEAEFNRWFAWNGKNSFHGFFNDGYGAIVLVVDDSLGNGDGGLPQYASGEIWFKNNGQQNCSIPPFGASTPCGPPAMKPWFIERGPYDMRTFLNGSGVVETTSALYPSTSNGYTKLGRFVDLEVKKAFNVK